LVLAVPVAPKDTLRKLWPEVDEIVCLQAPRDFRAVGHFYRSFPQLRDAEVTALLEQAQTSRTD
jgi:putative phosphoribosyl transferase